MTIRQFIIDALHKVFLKLATQSVTWAELKALRDSKKLSPGASYRITDYVASTIQEDTRSAGHRFDIIVTATSKRTLSEEAKACLHEGDTYFKNAGAKLDAWKIWYCLDNDTNRFAWAEDLLSPQTHKKILLVKKPNGVPEDPPYIYVRYPGRDGADDSATGLAWAFDNHSFLNIKDYVDGGVEELDASNIIFTQSENISIGDILDMAGTDVEVVETSWGTGVIYRMIDEWENDCPYDFKGIQFLRDSNWLTDGGNTQLLQNGLNLEFSLDQWWYTFTWLNEDPFAEDLSLIGYTLKDDGNEFPGCNNNIIKPTTENGSTKYMLSCNVFIASYNYDNGNYYGIVNNSIEEDSYFNTFVCYASRNTIGKLCSWNRLNSFDDNHIGIYFCNNYVSIDFKSNVIGCFFDHNTILGHFDGNVIDGNFVTNTIESDFTRNNIGADLSGNDFKESIQYASLVNNIKYCTIYGNISYLTMEGHNYYLRIYTNTIKTLENITIKKGVSGEDNNYKTINVKSDKEYTTSYTLSINSAVFFDAEDHIIGTYSTEADIINKAFSEDAFEYPIFITGQNLGQCIYTPPCNFDKLSNSVKNKLNTFFGRSFSNISFNGENIITGIYVNTGSRYDLLTSSWPNISVVFSISCLINGNTKILLFLAEE